ncbi:MAG: hypothetical protein ABJF11_01030 [Reichenbachiella sp.]|uniref:hypothetical protein n=1 Tax=Reichenbachiella sp. TaxID=2184521 RepID=UPI003264B5C9
MRKRIIRATTWSCLLAMASCHVTDLDKIKPATISPNLALNLGFTEYTVRELLEDLDSESLVDGPENTLALHFEDSTVFNDTEELISISSVENQEEFAPAENVPSSAVGYEIDINTTFTFSFPANNGEQIDSLFYSSGTLDFDMVSTFKGDIDYTWVIEGTREVVTNEDLTQSNQLEYTSGNVTDTYSRPLDGLKSKFYENADGENEFQVVVTGTISFETGTEILPSQKMEFDLAFNNPTFNKMYGIFGSDPIALQSQTIDMASFDEFSGEGLKLEDPSVLLITENSFGLDLELSFDEIKAIGSDDSELLLVQKDPPGIDGFVSSSLVEGEIKVDSIILDKTNSNIDDLLNSTPVAMDFTISAVPNPASSSRDNNFLIEDSEIKIKSLIIVPMQFQMDGFTVDFEFDLDGLDIDDAESIVFNLISTNEIPFNGSIDLNFVDDQGNTIYSIPGAADIESPDVGTTGKTTEPKITNSGIELTSEGIDALLEAQKILAVANISTFEAEEDRFVTLYADYILKIELSLAGEVTIEL